MKPGNETSEMKKVPLFTKKNVYSTIKGDSFLKGRMFKFQSSVVVINRMGSN